MKFLKSQKQKTRIAQGFAGFNVWWAILGSNQWPPVWKKNTLPSQITWFYI